LSLSGWSGDAIGRLQRRPQLGALHQGTTLIFDRRKIDRLFDRFNTETSASEHPTSSAWLRQFELEKIKDDTGRWNKSLRCDAEEGARGLDRERESPKSPPAKKNGLNADASKRLIQN
jgi:hypothetical protein